MNSIERRIKALETGQVRIEGKLKRIYEQLGLHDDDLLKMEWEEAMDALAAGDRSLMDEHLKRINEKKK